MRAPLVVFLVVCACSLFCNAGRSCENSSERVLIVLDLSCCGNENEQGARANPVDDRRSGIMILLSPGVVLLPTPPVPSRGLVHVNARICLGICHAYVYGGSQVP